MAMTGIIVGIAVPILVVMFLIWAARYTKAGPNEVLIISGRRSTMVDLEGMKKVVGYRIVRGGGTFVWPIRERVQRLSLELMDVDVKTPEVYTVYGVPVAVDGVAQIKIKGDDASVAVAAEQFLSRSKDDVMTTALQVTEGFMRAILGTMSIEDIYTKRSEFARRVKEAATPDLARMGLEIISLTIRNISDPRGYLEAVGRPRIAQVKRDAVIGEAEADKEAKGARYEADTKIEEARRDHEMKKAEFERAISEKKAEADLAYELQKHKTAQLVKKEEIRVGVIEKEMQIELQAKESLRREKELEATVAKPVEAERRKIETLAEAEKYRQEVEACGEAEAIRSKGLAEAEVILQKGKSEADVMDQKAEAWGQYNEAAITEMFVNILPQLASAVSEPLSKTEKIVVISNGGDSAGINRITKDVTEVIAQLPPVIESLTGVKLEEMVKRLPGIKGRLRGELKGDKNDGGEQT
jgi:flotillin